MAPVLAGGALAAQGTDGAEQIGVLVALVGRQARAASRLRPKPDAAVLLAEPAIEHALILARMLRPAADVGEGEPGKQIGDRPLAVDDAKALLDHPLEVDPSPAYDAVRRRIGAPLHDFGQRLHLSLAEPSWAAATRTVRQALRTFPIEAVRPVSQRLPVHAADPSGVRPAHAVIDRRQGQKPADLPRIPAALGQGAQDGGVIVVSELNGRCHGESPSPRLESHPTPKGNPPRVRNSCPWYTF
jgi:hypothetical protein